MLQMNQPTLNPVTSRKNGASAVTPIPFLQPGMPLHLPFQEACRQIQLPKITDSRGSLSFIEGGNHIPFEIESARWISDVSESAATRGKTSSAGIRRRQEFIIAISGSVEVIYDNGGSEKRVRLDRPDLGLYVPNAARRQVRTLSKNSAVLILNSAPTHGKLLA